MNEPAIVLDDLSKSFGDVHAVQNLSLTIAPGTIFGFLGPNGAGKTTTMRMLCGLAHPTGGKATIAGVDVWKIEIVFGRSSATLPSASAFIVI